MRRASPANFDVTQRLQDLPKISKMKLVAINRSRSISINGRLAL